MESRGTNKEVTVNRPDINFTNIKEKICMLTDVATPADRNVTQKRTETNRNTRVNVQGYNECSNWGHRNSNSRFEEKFGSHTR